MTDTKTETKIHPRDIELSDFLSRSLAQCERDRIEEHVASCSDCLSKIVSAYEAVESAGYEKIRKRKVNFMKRINIFLILAIVSFTASFAMPKYFIQLLVATLLFGTKWIVDSKSTKMLVMIYEAWKKGGEKEASKILERLDSVSKNRF